MSGLLRRWEEASSLPVPSSSSDRSSRLSTLSAARAREGVRPIPPFVSFFLRFLARSVERNRHTWRAAEAREESVAPRVDTQTSDVRAGVGGWLAVFGPDGKTRSHLLGSRRRSRSVTLFGSAPGTATRLESPRLWRPWLSCSRSGPSIPHSLVKPERRLCWSPVSQTTEGTARCLTNSRPVDTLCRLCSWS